jgi:hypothetical protein
MGGSERELGSGQLAIGLLWVDPGDFVWFV